MLPVSTFLWSPGWHCCDRGMHWPTGSWQCHTKPSIQISATVIPDMARPATTSQPAAQIYMSINFSISHLMYTQILKMSFGKQHKNTCTALSISETCKKRKKNRGKIKHTDGHVIITSTSYLQTLHFIWVMYCLTSILWCRVNLSHMEKNLNI